MVVAVEVSIKFFLSTKKQRNKKTKEKSNSPDVRVGREVEVERVRRAGEPGADGGEERVDLEGGRKRRGGGFFFFFFSSR